MATEDDDYRTVYGVEFYQPPDTVGLNEKSVTDDTMHLFWLMIAAVPVIGISIPIACLTFGYSGRHTNDFRIYEQLWKVGVYGAVIQTISFLFLLITTALV